MSALVSAAKLIGSPGSLGFLALCGAAGVIVALTGPRGRRIGRAWLLAVAAAYLLAALPIVSFALLDRLPQYAPLWQPGGVETGDMVVVLSGDNPRGRARETRRVLDRISPRCVLVSGSPWFARMVASEGVSRNRLRVDDTASTTREQVEKLPLWAEQCGALRVVLIASRLSMPRLSALVGASSIRVVLAPSPLDESPPDSGMRLAVPSLRALRLTKDALYEHMALAYYRHRRWIR